MSRICRNMGDSGKLRFYELDHGSKMRLLKTHYHTSNRLAMDPGTREPHTESSMAMIVMSPTLVFRFVSLPRRGSSGGVTPTVWALAAVYRYIGGRMYVLLGAELTNRGTYLYTEEKSS